MDVHGVCFCGETVVVMKNKYLIRHRALWMRGCPRDVLVILHE